MNFQIKDYVPIAEKVNIIDISVKQSLIEGVINPVLLDAFFNLNMFLIYTDYEVENEEISIADLYDEYARTLIPEFLQEMGENHYDELVMMEEYLYSYKSNYEKYINSVKGVVVDLLEIISVFMNNNVDDIRNFDFSQLKNIVPIAESLGFNFDQLKSGEAKE